MKKTPKLAYIAPDTSVMALGIEKNFCTSQKFNSVTVEDLEEETYGWEI